MYVNVDGVLRIVAPNGFWQDDVCPPPPPFEKERMRERVDPPETLVYVQPRPSELAESY